MIIMTQDRLRSYFEHTCSVYSECDPYLTENYLKITKIF